MSNISPFGGKNPPWARGVTNNNSNNLIGQPNHLQQQIITQNALGAAMGASGMVQYQQPQQVFQTQMNMTQPNLGLGMSQLSNSPVTVPGGIASQLSNQMFSQVGAITYPPRTLNPSAFQSTSSNAVTSVQNPSAASTKQRVFTGTVTKVHDNFGFIDEDVFFQMSACVKGSNPIVGDRVLVEASYNANMPFKWNATKIQVLPMTGVITNRHTPQNTTKLFNTGNNTYNAVPPPSESSSNSYSSSNRSSREPRSKQLGGRGRSRERSRDDDDMERKKRREEREKTREKEDKDKKSPAPRRRSRSPKRRRLVILPRYMVHIPKIALDLPEADVLEIRRRYNNLYIPSDFFLSQFRWVDAFPPTAPFTLNKPCSFHIMHKDVDPVKENDALLEPSDADYLFSAKVMLMSMPTMQEVYQKCCSMAEEKERDRESEERDFVHPTRLVNFLVGLRGKNETMAVGGPWSPSLDGPDPEKNSSVLINTAIRTCKALTGIDLSTCTQWYRFVELYYRRGESTHKGKLIPARVETVVLFLPDVWSCVPTRLEWDSLQASYRRQLEQRLQPGGGPQDADDVQTPAAAADDKDDDSGVDDKCQPTHYSELDPKTMSVKALRNELKARNINCRGIKSQLVAKLAKALKAEAEKTGELVEEEIVEVEAANKTASDSVEKVDKTDKEGEEKKIDEKEKAILEKRYNLPDTQHIIVHPSRTAKSGKFDCTVMSLSLLLDYRPEDTKEHSFEVSLFAELFNEMLMRDFGFNIYKSLRAMPEKIKEDKDDKKRKDDDKKKDRDEDKGEKDEDKERRDDKKSRKDDEEENEDDEEEDKKDKKKLSDKDRDRKKKDRPKLVTKDPHLLLSFVYFDQTHCGYIFEKDVEDLLYTLGLSLSRAQVRKLVSKVVTRDSLLYRKLTDKPKDECDIPVTEETQNDDNSDELVSGNKRLLPIFKDDTVNGVSPQRKRVRTEQPLTEQQKAEGFVMYQGGLLHVDKLMAQLKRIEKACADTEARLVELKEENKKLLEKNSKSSNTIKEISSELKENKEKLHITNSALDRMTTCSKLFHSTLKDIKKQIEPVIGYSLFNENEEKVRISESRWGDPNEKVNSLCKDELSIKKEGSTEMEIESLDEKEHVLE